MRFLANENFPGPAVAALRQIGYDVAWVRTDAPGSTDAQVLLRANQEQRILLTFDKDFGDLVFRRGSDASFGVLLFRISLTSALEVAQRVVSAVTSRSDWEGQFWVIEQDRVRVRPLPLP